MPSASRPIHTGRPLVSGAEPGPRRTRPRRRGHPDAERHGDGREGPALGDAEFDGRFAYVANEASGDVSVVDLADRRVVTDRPGRPGAAQDRRPAEHHRRGGPADPHGPDGRRGLRVPPSCRRRTTGNGTATPGDEPLEHAPQLHAAAQRIDQDIGPGDTVEIKLAIPVSEAYFFCKFHAALGQRGELIATGAVAPVR